MIIKKYERIMNEQDKVETLQLNEIASYIRYITDRMTKDAEELGKISKATDLGVIV